MKIKLIMDNRTHTELKPYEVNVVIVKMLSHSRTHTGIYLVNVAIVIRVFHKYIHLVNHLRTHTVERLYQ